MNNVVNLRNSKTSFSVAQVLKKLIDDNHLNVSQLSKNTGLSNTTIKRMCTEDEANPTLSSVEKLADFFGIKASQMLGLEPLTTQNTGYFPKTEFWNNVPLLTLEESLFWPENEKSIKENKLTQYAKTDIDISDKTFAIIAKNGTLEPRFPDGTVLIIEPDRTPKNKDFVLVLINSKKLPQFRQIFVDGSDYYVKAINPDMANVNQLEPINFKCFKLIGIIIQAKIEFF